MIETMLRPSSRPIWAILTTTRPKDGANRRNGYTTKRGHVGRRGWRYRCPATATPPARAGRGAQGRARPVRHRVARADRTRGMSQRSDIAATVRDIYGFSISAETVSAITDRIWRSSSAGAPAPRAGLRLHVRGLHLRAGQARRGARNVAVYCIVAYDLEGRKDVLGLWMQEMRAPTTGWACSTSCAGAGSRTCCSSAWTGCRAWPTACARYSGRRGSAASCTWYATRASTCRPGTCRRSAGTPGSTARRRWPRAGRLRRLLGEVGAPTRAPWRPGSAASQRSSKLFSFGPDVRRVMYTTNCVESVNASFRKVVRRGCFPDEDAVMAALPQGQ